MKVSAGAKGLYRGGWDSASPLEPTDDRLEALPEMQFASCPVCDPQQPQSKEAESSGFRHSCQVSLTRGNVHNSLGELSGRGTKELGRGATYGSPVVKLPR